MVRFSLLRLQLLLSNCRRRFRHRARWLLVAWWVVGCASLVVASESVELGAGDKEQRAGREAQIACTMQCRGVQTCDPVKWSLHYSTDNHEQRPPELRFHELLGQLGLAYDRVVCRNAELEALLSSLGALESATTEKVDAQQNLKISIIADPNAQQEGKVETELIGSLPRTICAPSIVEEISDAIESAPCILPNDQIDNRRNDLAHLDNKSDLAMASMDLPAHGVELRDSSQAQPAQESVEPEGSLMESYGSHGPTTTENADPQHMTSEFSKIEEASRLQVREVETETIGSLPSTIYVALIVGETADDIEMSPCPLSDSQIENMRNDLRHLGSKYDLAMVYLDLPARRVELRSSDQVLLEQARIELEGPLMEFYCLRGPDRLRPGEVAWTANRQLPAPTPPDAADMAYADLPEPPLESLLGPKQKARAIRTAESRNEQQKLAVGYWAGQWEEYLKENPTVPDMDQEQIIAHFKEMQDAHQDQQRRENETVVPRVHFSAVAYFLGQWGRVTCTMSTKMRKTKIAKNQARKEAQRAAVKFWADRWEEHIKANLHLIGADRDVMKADFDIMQAAHTGTTVEKAHFGLVMNFCRQSGRRKIGTWKDYEARSKEFDDEKFNDDVEQKKAQAS